MFTVRTSHFSLHHSQLIRCCKRLAFCRTQKIGILLHWKIGFHRTQSVLTIPPTTLIMAGQPPTWLCAHCHWLGSVPPAIDLALCPLPLTWLCAPCHWLGSVPPAIDLALCPLPLTWLCAPCHCPQYVSLVCCYREGCKVFSLQNPWKHSGTMWNVQWKRNLTLWMSKKCFQT